MGMLNLNAIIDIIVLTIIYKRKTILNIVVRQGYILLSVGGEKVGLCFNNLNTSKLNHVQKISI